MVDTNAELVDVAVERLHRGQVLNLTRSGRQGRLAEKRRRDRIQAISRYLIAGEHAPARTRRGITSQRVAQRSQSREITTANRGRGNRERLGQGPVRPLPFETEEEERPVTDDRPAQRSTKLILVERWDRRGGPYRLDS